MCAAASEVRDILEDPASDNLESNTPSFWLLVAALKKFVVSATHQITCLCVWGGGSMEAAHGLTGRHTSGGGF